MISCHRWNCSRIQEAVNYPLSKYWQKKLGRKQGLKIDHDDSLNFAGREPFALLLHGRQPTGSEAAEALKKLGGVSGKSSYSWKKQFGETEISITDEELVFS
jgi:hypothetical protein